MSDHVDEQLTVAELVAAKVTAGERPSRADPCSPGACPNCEEPQRGKLYCSDLCMQIGELVRYCRKKLTDGGLIVHRDGSKTWADPLVERDGYQMRLAMILGGGYRATERHLPPAIRKAVLDRDGHRCVRCGATEELEIDHVHGDAAELSNLQVLCKTCNGDKARALFMPATAPGHREAVAALWRRILAPVPARVVDDVERWQTVWRKLQPPKPSCEGCGKRVPLVDGLCEPCAEARAE